MNKCACIEGNRFDFVVTAVDDCQSLLLQDLSIWMEGPNYYKPESYDLYISQGGPGKKITVKTDGFTVIPITEDGVYCFKAVIADQTFTRYRTNACKLECCLQEYIYQLVEKNGKEDEWDKAEHIRKLIDLSMYNASIKNIDYAQQIYEAAKTEIEELNCNCKCLKK